MTTSIELSDPKQKAVYKELLETCNKIEAILIQPIEPDDPASVERQLADRIMYLGYTARMMEIATAVYDYAKGMAADMALTNDNLMEAKQDIQRKWMEGRLARYSAMYAKVETLVKDLRNSCNGLITIISFEKSKMQNERLAT